MKAKIEESRIYILKLLFWLCTRLRINPGTQNNVSKIDRYTPINSHYTIAEKERRRQK